MPDSVGGMSRVWGGAEPPHATEHDPQPQSAGTLNWMSSQGPLFGCGSGDALDRRPLIVEAGPLFRVARQRRVKTGVVVDPPAPDEPALATRAALAAAILHIGTIPAQKAHRQSAVADGTALLGVAGRRPPAPIV